MTVSHLLVWLAAPALYGAVGFSFALALAAVALLVVAVVRWPPFGLAVLIVGSLIAPVALSTGSRTDLNFTLLWVPILMGLWLPTLLRRHGTRVFSARPIPPLVAFIATALLSFAVANQPWVFVAPTAPLGAQLGGLSVFVFSAGVFLMAADQLRNPRWLAILTWLFLGVSCLYLATQLVPGLEPLASLRLQRGANGSLFWTWLVALAFGQAAFNRRMNVFLRLALAGLVLAVFFVTLTRARDWLSCWVPPLVAVVATLWAGAPRLALPVTITAGAAAALKIPTVLAVVMSPGNQYSLMTRLEAWRVLAKIVRASPALGLGPANYYHATPLFPILGYYVRFSSHNTYVDIITQTGLIGFGCFAWFIWELGRLGWALRRRAPSGFASAYVHGAIGGLAGTLAAGMLGDWVLPFVYNVTLNGVRASVLGWLFLGGLVAIEETTRKGVDQR